MARLPDSTRSPNRRERGESRHASVIVGRLIFVPLMRIVRLARSPSVPAVLAVAYCFLMAALAELVGLADIVGAFTAGLVVNDEIGRFFGEKKELYRIDASIRASTAGPSASA